MTSYDLQPYKDLTIVTLEQAVAAPLCSRHFADGGARVIKVERPEGDFARNYDSAVNGCSAYFVWANYGKQSVCLNIKDPKDLSVLKAMIAKADIFIQNLAPGATSRIGISSQQLRETHKRLITCDITGYGATGHYSNMKAYDFLVQCESGLVAVNGAPEAMGRIGVSVCDIGASQNAIIGIQRALYQREKTGQGSGVEVSLFDTAADWMSVPYLQTENTGKAPKPAGLRHPSIAPYGGFKAKDGNVIAISIQNDREWLRFCAEVLRDENLAQKDKFQDGPSRVEHRDELESIIGTFFAERTSAELEELLFTNAIAFGRVNSLEDALVHTQLRRLEIELEHGASASVIANPVIYSGGIPGEKPVVPSCGQHTSAVRSEFGNDNFNNS